MAQPAEVGMFEGREWFGCPGASPEALDALRRAAPVELPESYCRLLAFSNGGEGPLPIGPLNLCLDSAEEVVARLGRGQVEDPDLAGFLIFGSNGGLEHIAFDLRNGSPLQVVYIDMIAGYGSVAPLAANFDALLDIIGVDGGPVNGKGPVPKDRPPIPRYATRGKGLTPTTPKTLKRFR